MTSEVILHWNFVTNDLEFQLYGFRIPVAYFSVSSMNLDLMERSHAFTSREIAVLKKVEDIVISLLD